MIVGAWGEYGTGKRFLIWTRLFPWRAMNMKSPKGLMQAACGISELSTSRRSLVAGTRFGSLLFSKSKEDTMAR